MSKYVIICEKCKDVWISNNYISPYNQNFHFKEGCYGHIFDLVSGNKINIEINGKKRKISKSTILKEYYKNKNISMKLL